MRRVTAVAIVSLKDWTRSRSSIFWSLAFPIMLLLIFGFVFGDTTTRYALLLKNEDVDAEGRPTQLSEAFVGALDSTGVLDLKLIGPDVSVDEAVRENGVYRVLIIPKEFEESTLRSSLASRMGVVVELMDYVVRNFNTSMTQDEVAMIERGRIAIERYMSMLSHGPANLTYLMDPNDPGSRAVEGVIRGVVSEFNARLIGVNESLVLKRSELGIRRTRSIDYMVPGLIGAFVMTNGVIGGANFLSDLRRRQLLRRLMVTPLRKEELIIGLLLVQVLFSTALTMVMLLIGWSVFGSVASLNPASLLLVVVGSLLFTSLGLTIGAALKEVESVNAASSTIAFPMMFLSGAFWPLEMMPATMQTIAKFLPLYYIVEGLRATSIYGDLGGLVLALIVGVPLSIAFLASGSALLRWKGE